MANAFTIGPQGKTAPAPRSRPYTGMSASAYFRRPRGRRATIVATDESISTNWVFHPARPRPRIFWAQVRDLLRLADQRNHSCQEVDAIARVHLGEVERKIADLDCLRRELADLIEQCSHGTVAECRIVDALSSIAAV